MKGLGVANGEHEMVASPTGFRGGRGRRSGLASSYDPTEWGKASVRVLEVTQSKIEANASFCDTPHLHRAMAELRTMRKQRKAMGGAPLAQLS